MFLIHMLTDAHPFLSRDLFRDRNLTVGLVFTALAGLVLIVTATLMPPFLQQLKGYPVFTTGIVLAPRGAGMMVAMMITARLIGRFDARWLIAAGLLRTEGAAINALMRNLGASIGIAVLVSLLARNTQENRAELVGQLTPYSAGWPFGRVMPGPDSQMLAVWDAEINRQAAMIGYLNDFRAMTICTLVVIPLLFFMRKQMLAR